MKIRFVAIAVIAFSAIYAHAGSISCSTATSLVPDGRLLDFDSVQANTTNWYQFTAIAGRSYSVEVRDDLDPNNTDLVVTYAGPTGSCPNPNAITSASAVVTDTRNYEPVLPTSAARSSLVICVAAGNPSGFCTGGPGGGTYWVKVQNTSATTSHYVSVSVTETTLYSPSWSTNLANTATQFIVSNTTSQPVTFTITVTATSVSPPITYTTGPLILGAPSSSTSNQILNTGSNFSPSVPNNQTGYVILTHNGPPGAAQVQEYYQIITTLGGPATVLAIPTPIGPVRGK